MIYIVGMPFVALMIAIIVIGMMRGLRQAGELRNRPSGFPIYPGGRRPSDDYHDQTWLPLCKSVAQAAEAKLHRPLNGNERRRIWRTRTALTLEVVLKEIEATADAAAIAALLTDLPPGMDRPDPGAQTAGLFGWCAATP